MNAPATAQNQNSPVVKSFAAKPAEALAARKWWVVDATDQPLGRLASKIAMVLRGKNKPTFTPHVDTGDFVIVVNAQKVKLTGRKLDQKKYVRHSGEPGGFREEAYGKLLVRQPELPVTKAVKGMLPKNILGRELLTKLKVYAGPDHPHAAQKPEPLR
jgi:large subunit ribosomal protein L13